MNTTTGFSSSEDEDEDLSKPPPVPIITTSNNPLAPPTLPNLELNNTKQSSKQTSSNNTPSSKQSSKKRKYVQKNINNHDISKDIPILHKTKKFKGHRKLNEIESLTLDNTLDWEILPHITSVSIQGRLKLKRPLNLLDIVLILPNCEYRPEEFVAVRCRLKNPTIMVTIFSTGVLTTQGAKSIRTGVIAIRKVAKMLSKYLTNRNDITSIFHWRMWGIQGNAKIKNSINLINMSEYYPNKANYTDDIHQSLKYLDPIKYGNKGLCQIYDNGTITIMGCQNINKFILWIQDMYNIVKPFIYDKQKILNNMDNNIIFEDIDLGDFTNDIDNNNNNDNNIVNNDNTPAWLISSSNSVVMNNNNEQKNNENNIELNEKNMNIDKNEENKNTKNKRLPPSLENI